MGVTGWTEAEYMACPELASRLHGRILDLQDALDAAIYHADNLRRYIDRVPVRDLSESGAGFEAARRVLEERDAL